MSAIAKVNAMIREEFVALFGPLYEHSPWAAERAFGRKPFVGEEALVEALAAAVDGASEAEKLTLICAHPELASEKLQSRALTASSMSEQQGAGLDQLDPREIEEWAKLRSHYRERFCFPFVICVRKHSKDEIIAAMRRRLELAPDAERRQAISQIHQIAELRLRDILAGLSGRA